MPLSVVCESLPSFPLSPLLPIGSIQQPFALFIEMSIAAPPKNTKESRRKLRNSMGRVQNTVHNNHFFLTGNLNEFRELVGFFDGTGLSFSMSLQKL